MNDTPTWPAKLLLFGEYSILLGSSALSMPFNHFGASLRFPDTEHDALPDNGMASNLELQKFFGYFLENSDIFEEFLDLEQFSSDLREVLYLSSTIPQRYGMGSSGALCTAIYDRYTRDETGIQPAPGKDKLFRLRSRFTLMESFFHGKSSGFDPLVIYLQKMVRLESDNSIIPIDILPDEGADHTGILLVDSGLTCSTGPRVREFLDRFAPGGEVTSAGEQMIGLANACIDQYLAGNSTSFTEAVRRLSGFQFDTLPHLIPSHLQPVWREGLSTGLFSPKLCGSGGGGFMICFTREREQASQFFEQKNIAVKVVC